MRGLFREAGEGPVDAWDVEGVGGLEGGPEGGWRVGVGEAIAVAIGFRFGGGFAFGVGRRFGVGGVGVVLLGGEEVAAQRVGELEVGPVCARLADDGGAARDDVPEGLEWKSRN